MSITDDERRLRSAILELCDCMDRYRLLKDIGDIEEADKFRTTIEAHRKSISSIPLFAALDEKRRKRLLSGEEPYIKGKAEVARSAGWQDDDFKAIYKFLSSHAHSAPVSFFRTNESPDLAASSDYQYISAGQALEYATGALGTACEQMFSLYPELFLRRQAKH
jgi:hypothetical protein